MPEDAGTEKRVLGGLIVAAWALVPAPERPGFAADGNAAHGVTPFKVSIDASPCAAGVLAPPPRPAIGTQAEKAKARTWGLIAQQRHRSATDPAPVPARLFGAQPFPAQATGGGYGGFGRWG